MITRGFGIEGGGLGGTVFVDGLEVRIEPDLVVLLEPEAVAVGLVNQIDVTLSDWEPPPPPIPIVYLLRDEFATNSPAPLDASRDCEPGPGTMEKTTDADGNCYILGDVFVLDQVNGEGAPSYRFKTVSQFDHDPGNCFYAAIKSVGQLNAWIQFGSFYASNGLPGLPRLYETGFIDGGGTTVQVWGGFDQDVLNKLWIIFRSIGAFLIINGDLKWVDHYDAVITINRALGIRSAYTGAGWSAEVHDTATLNLPAQTQLGVDWSVWDADFSTVLVENAVGDHLEISPLDTETVGDFSIEFDLTRSDPPVQNNFVRGRADGGVDSFYVGVGGTGSTALFLYDYGLPGLLVNVAGVFLGGTTVNVKMTVAADGSFKVFADNIEKGSGTLTLAGRTVKDFEHYKVDAADTQTDFVCNPFPSLGIATDRIVAPQSGIPDNGTHEQDFVACLRNFVLGSGSCSHHFRYTDLSNSLILDTQSSGDPNVWDAGVRIINGSPGDVSSGDEVTLIVEGNQVSLYVNGVLIGGPATITNQLTGTVYNYRIDNNATVDAVELWPRDVSALLPSELI